MYTYGYQFLVAIFSSKIIVKSRMQPERPDKSPFVISPFVKFAQAEKYPFVALHGRSLIRSWVCTPGQISVYILLKYITLC